MQPQVFAEFLFEHEMSNVLALYNINQVKYETQDYL